MSKFIKLIDPPKELRRKTNPVEVLTTKLFKEPISVACPFCGSPLSAISFTLKFGKGEDLILICKNCGAEFRGPFSNVVLDTNGGGIVIKGFKIEEIKRGIL